jgi:hypothetical protein
MFKKVKESIVIALSIVMFSIPMLVPIAVSAVDCTATPPASTDPPGCTAPKTGATAGSGADIRSNLCGGADLNADSAGANCATNVDQVGAKDANDLIKNVINIFSLVVGIVAVIMIIVAGFRYITSGGNDGNVSTAKNTILYAVIGLIVVALAQIIVRFVLAKATTRG